MLIFVAVVSPMVPAPVAATSLAAFGKLIAPAAKPLRFLPAPNVTVPLNVIVLNSPPDEPIVRLG